MLWHIELKFCIWLCFTVLHIQFDCCQFASIFEGVMPLLEPRILEIHSFPQFYSNMLWYIELKFYIWTLLHCTADQVRVSSICVIFCGSYAPFWNLEYRKYTVFRTFLLHALPYWAEILHMTLFYCTTDQVWVSSICVNFYGSCAPFGT